MPAYFCRQCAIEPMAVMDPQGLSLSGEEYMNEERKEQVEDEARIMAKKYRNKDSWRH